MKPFEYHRAHSSVEALGLARQAPDGTGRLLAGGTDLLPLLQDRVVEASRLVDIKRVRDVDSLITVSEGGAAIGALATLADVADDVRLAVHARMLGQAARSAATPQIRAQATVGGNLLQRPRCWYFRNSAFRCWLEGGDTCPARIGQNQLHAIFPGGGDGNPCCAVHPSDLAPCLLALDAELLLRAADGTERAVSAETFFCPPSADRRTETVIGDQVLVAVHLPPLPTGTVTAYAKASARKTWSFALVSVAARLEVVDGLIADARLVLGGVATVPWRVPEAEALLRGNAPSDALFERAARRAVAGAQPLAHNRYKVALVRGLLGRTLRELCP